MSTISTSRLAARSTRAYYRKLMDNKLLTILACPAFKGRLPYDRNAAELICYADSLAFPIRDDIPVMLVPEARTLTDEEKTRRGKPTA